MPLRFLCLHGWGTNVQILQTQLEAVQRDLQSDNTAVFHFIEGDIESEPGPGIEGYFDGPFYSYYKFPRTFHDSEHSILDAYELLYDVIEDEGPFDGVLGFSHGGTLASGFLMHHQKTRPSEPTPFRCAIFFSALPPFRKEPDMEPVVDDGMEDGCIMIPTVHVAGANDFVYQYSIHLKRLCDARTAQLVIHERGHDIPRDGKSVRIITQAIREMAMMVQNAW